MRKFLLIADNSNSSTRWVLDYDNLICYARDRLGLPHSVRSTDSKIIDHIAELARERRYYLLEFLNTEDAPPTEVHKPEPLSLPSSPPLPPPLPHPPLPCEDDPVYSTGHWIGNVSAVGHHVFAVEWKWNKRHCPVPHNNYLHPSDIHCTHQAYPIWMWGRVVRYGSIQRLPNEETLDPAIARVSCRYIFPTDK